MDRPAHVPEKHHVHRAGWLRAAVLGANDGIVSTASLLVGVAAAGTAREALLLTGVAGLVAGAMSMAAGEYVSVSAQADIERADLARERRELEAHPEYEHDELEGIYMDRGLHPDLAHEVAVQLMNHDALAAHARDELGITDAGSARPLQAALTSAATFAAGAALPLATTAVAPMALQIPVIGAASLLGLAVLGVTSARAGGAPVLRATTRVVVWGALAMILTAGVGRGFGAIV